jgi:hypothetical protein
MTGRITGSSMHNTRAYLLLDIYLDESFKGKRSITARVYPYTFDITVFKIVPKQYKIELTDQNDDQGNHQYYKVDLLQEIDAPNKQINLFL